MLFCIVCDVSFHCLFVSVLFVRCFIVSLSFFFVNLLFIVCFFVSLFRVVVYLFRGLDVTTIVSFFPCSSYLTFGASRPLPMTAALSGRLGVTSVLLLHQLVCVYAYDMRVFCFVRTAVVRR